MRKLLLVAKHEYLKMVRHKSFLLATLGMPILMTVVMLVAIFTAVGQRGELPVGYVDNAGVLDAQIPPELADGEVSVDFRRYESDTDAEAALRQEAIQGYFVLAEDYRDTAEVELIYLSKRPSELVTVDFENFLAVNLMAGLPQDVQNRLIAGNEVTMLSADGSRELSEDNMLNFLIPFIAAIGFVIASSSSAGYMLQAVTDEKENRTIEVLVTSVRPEMLIGGKAVGLLSVALTQLLIWGAVGVALLLVGAQFVPTVSNLDIPWITLVIVAFFFLPAFALQSGIMIAIGGMVTELQQGQQIMGIVNLFFNMPLFFLALIIGQPNSPFVIGLSLFPTSAFITTVLRWAITPVPWWQLVLSWLLLVVSAVTSVWAAARIFHAGMLRTGQRMSIKNVLTVLKGSRQQEITNA